MPTENLGGVSSCATRIHTLRALVRLRYTFLLGLVIFQDSRVFCGLHSLLLFNFPSKSIVYFFLPKSIRDPLLPKPLQVATSVRDAHQERQQTPKRDTNRSNANNHCTSKLNFRRQVFWKVCVSTRFQPVNDVNRRNHCTVEHELAQAANSSSNS